jgi:hypothetical protein
MTRFTTSASKQIVAKRCGCAPSPRPVRTWIKVKCIKSMRFASSARCRRGQGEINLYAVTHWKRDEARLAAQVTALDHQKQEDQDRLSILECELLAVRNDRNRLATSSDRVRHRAGG